MIIGKFTMRFVASSSSEIMPGCSIGLGSSNRVLVFGYLNSGKKRNLVPKLSPLDHDSHTSVCILGVNNSRKHHHQHHLLLRQHPERVACNALVDDQGGFGIGLWSTFSEFFKVVILQPESQLLDSSINSSESAHLHKSVSELPLLQVCGTTLPDPVHEIDSADEVLSQLLYAGFGSIGSTLDGLLSVIFPRFTGSPDESSMNLLEMEQQQQLSSSNQVSADDFAGSLPAFHAWLKERLPEKGAQLDLWGTAPGTKRVANLFRELLEGEITLEDSIPPKRNVNVASVRIRNEVGEMLVEAYQELADGRIRPRNRPLSEKMRPGESVEEACLRGISEELGAMGARERVILVRESYRRVEEERESFSYPGLLTRYVIHTITAHVHQLPSSDFDTEEDEDGNSSVLIGVMGSSERAVGVKKHFWKWVQAS